ncbi:MAG: four helix bundle protein [Bacteroidales bacterium]|nr:four helix bundle protein [Bacteroidales bacterium]
MKENILLDKSMAFAIRIVNMYKYLCDEKKEFVLSKQVLRSGTSIGANCREAKRGQSEADFIAKLFIALKEADETLYWLELLNKTDYLSQEVYTSISTDCNELIKLLVSIIKTTKSKKIECRKS